MRELLEVLKRHRLIVCVALGSAAALGALAMYLKIYHTGGESPILVRDGSMVLESKLPETLDDFVDVPNDVIVHPNGRGTVKKVIGTDASGAVKRATCRPSDRCWVEVTFTSGAWIKVFSGRAGAGLAVKTSNDFPQWDKSDPLKRTWKYNGTMEINEARVFGTDKLDPTPQNPDANLVCRGGNCKVEIHLKQ